MVFDTTESEVNFSALNALRHGISDLHQTLENQPFFKGLVAKTINEADYWQALQVLAKFYAKMEPALLAWPCPDSVPAYQPRLPLLSKDLQQLGLACLSSVDQSPLQNLSQYFGRRYVIEGSALGAKVILNHWQKHGPDPLPTFNFFNHQAESCQHWPIFQKALTNHLQTIAEVEMAIAEARICFEQLIADADSPVI